MKNRTPLMILIALLTFVLMLVYIGYNQSASESLATVKMDELVWRVNYRGNGYIVTEPLISDNKLYIQTNTKILVYDTFTGDLIWESQIPIQDDTIESWSPTSMKIDQTRVVVQSERTLITAYEKENGLQIWKGNSPNTKTFIRDIILQNNTLFISSNNSDISAINILDSTLIWMTNDVPSRTKMDLFLLDDKIILGTDRGLNVYSASDGQLLQTYEFNGFVETYSLEDDNLYISFDSGDCKFVSFNLRLMKNEWCVNVEFDFLLNNIESVYDNSNVYFFGNRMFAIDKNTGTLLWKTASESFFKNPVILSDFIYVSDGGYLYKINSLNGMKTLKIAIPLYAENNTTGLNWKPIVTPDLIITFSNSEITAYKNKFK